MASRAATASTPTWEFLVAAAGHVLLATLAVLARCGAGGAEPLFKPEDVMVVEMAGPPKNVTRMPQKAERAPDPAAGAPTAPAQPPPPNPSDMAFQTPDAKASKGDPTADATRERLRSELKRRSLLEDLDAPIGTEDRAASNPEGGEDAGSAYSAGIRDPELAKWRAASEVIVNGNWHPLPSICRASPDLTVVVAFLVDGSGRKQGAAEIAQPSGNASIDGSALRAAEQTASLPAPPPKYAAEGIRAQVKLECKDHL